MQTVGKLRITRYAVHELISQYELVGRGDGHFLYCRPTGFSGSDHHQGFGNCIWCCGLGVVYMAIWRFRAGAMSQAAKGHNSSLLQREKSMV